MRWELWERTDPDDGVHEYRFLAAPKYEAHTQGYSFVWAVHAFSWNEAHTRMYEFLGWGPYVNPFDGGDEEWTTPSSNWFGSPESN